MAKAAIETAFWDAEAKQKNLPLAKLLGGTRDEIPCGVSIGIQPTITGLVAKVEEALAAGYQRIKIKIKPGLDVEPVRALRERFPSIRLMVDANSAYRLEDAPLLKALDAYYLIMIEQPLGWDDIYSHAQLQRQLETPICLDECIHDVEHARAAIETGACRIINIKLGRVGGHASARRIHDLCQANAIPVWCGGMLESGIGRAHNIAMSSLANFSLPGDVSASRRYWAEDIIEPEVEVTRQGTIRVPTAPGIGYAPRLDRIESLTQAARGTGIACECRGPVIDRRVQVAPEFFSPRAWSRRCPVRVVDQLHCRKNHAEASRRADSRVIPLSSVRPGAARGLF